MKIPIHSQSHKHTHIHTQLGIALGQLVPTMAVRLVPAPSGMPELLLGQALVASAALLLSG